MTLKIFADLMSQPSRALPLFCRAAKIPHELKELRIQKGEFKSPEISKINPLQTVSNIIYKSKVHRKYINIKYIIRKNMHLYFFSLHVLNIMV